MLDLGYSGQFVIFLLAAIVAFVEGSLILDAVHPAQAYKFGYAVKDHHGEQHREESGNGAGGVVGNYGFTDDRGIARQVNYVADHAGFRAQVKTNEPGTANQNPAAVHVISNDKYAQGAAVPYVSVPNSPYVAGAVLANPVTGLDNHHHGYAPVHHGYAPLHHQGYNYGPVGALGYSGLLGGYGGIVNYGAPLAGGAIRGYGGIVNYGAPLVGGAIRGYDSRFVNLA